MKNATASTRNPESSPRLKHEDDERYAVDSEGTEWFDDAWPMVLCGWALRKLKCPAISATERGILHELIWRMNDKGVIRFVSYAQLAEHVNLTPNYVGRVVRYWEALGVLVPETCLRTGRKSYTIDLDRLRTLGSDVVLTRAEIEEASGQASRVEPLSLESVSPTHSGDRGGITRVIGGVSLESAHSKNIEKDHVERSRCGNAARASAPSDPITRKSIAVPGSGRCQSPSSRGSEADAKEDRSSAERLWARAIPTPSRRELPPAIRFELCPVNAPETGEAPEAPSGTTEPVNGQPGASKGASRGRVDGSGIEHRCSIDIDPDKIAAFDRALFAEDEEPERPVKPQRFGRGKRKAGGRGKPASGTRRTKRMQTWSVEEAARVLNESLKELRDARRNNRGTELWKNAEIRHVVAAYALIHEEIYDGKLPEGFTARYGQVMRAASAMLREMFDGDTVEISKYFAWLLRREKAGAKRGWRYLGWQLAFSEKLFHDYRGDVVAGKIECPTTARSANVGR